MNRILLWKTGHSAGGDAETDGIEGVVVDVKGFWSGKE
jgi:hypothetical protein